MADVFEEARENITIDEPVVKTDGEATIEGVVSTEEASDVVPAKNPLLEPVSTEEASDVVPAKNPLLEPTKQTADEIVAEIMSQVSDKGVRDSLERMGKLEDELMAKIKKMQTTFEEHMSGIQSDIDKFWAIDKEYAKYHGNIDTVDAGKGPLDETVKETTDKVPTNEVPVKDEVNLEAAPSETTLSNNPDLSTSIESVESIGGSEKGSEKGKTPGDHVKTKTSKARKSSEDLKSKPDDAKGRKTTKKKGGQKLFGMSS